MNTKVKYILPVLMLLLGKTAFSQSSIVLKTLKDTVEIAEDVPVDIYITPQAKIDSFEIFVLNKKQFARAFHVSPSRTNNANVVPSSAPGDEEETDFEIASFGKWRGHGNTVIAAGGDTNRIVLKIWDPGIFMIIPALIRPDTAGFLDTVYINQDNEPLVVLPGINAQDTIKEIAPINDIIREKKVWTDYKWWIIAAALLVLVTLAMIFLPKLFLSRKKESIAGEKRKPALPAHIIALNKLAKLKKEKIWKEGKVKEFQSQLTHILREYLENRYHIKALEQTTSEIIDSLIKINMPEKYITLISEILQIADLVKFAKAKPGEDINEKFLDKTIEFVEETKEQPAEGKT